MRFIRISSFLIALVLAFASASAGQTARPPAPVAESSVRAGELLARAEQVQSDRSRLVEAARLYQRGARLLPADDARVPETLRTAARLLFYAGRTVDARAQMESAAGVAFDQGDVFQAAQAYIDATFIALQLREFGNARRLIDRAVIVATSERLTDEQRSQILHRIAQPMTALSRLTNEE